MILCAKNWCAWFTRNAPFHVKVSLLLLYIKHLNFMILIVAILTAKLYLLKLFKRFLWIKNVQAVCLGEVNLMPFPLNNLSVQHNTRLIHSWTSLLCQSFFRQKWSILRFTHSAIMPENSLNHQNTLKIHSDSKTKKLFYNSQYLLLQWKYFKIIIW